MADLAVAGPVTSEAVKPLRDQVRGRVIAAADEGYDEARTVHNGMFDRRPLAVLKAEQVGDVIAAVNFAREHGLDLSVRGGMHSGPGFGTNDGGLVIDMSQMRTVRVDPRNKTARADAGATWGDFNYATHAFGLATTGGIISTTGISGLTLGGGIGYLARGLGLTIDNLISADVVTADGRFLTASERENEDLFWGLRGGGGNFGVVTSLEYRLHEVDQVFAGPIFYNLEDAATVFRMFDEFIRDAPEEFGGFPGFQIAPPLPFIPEDRHGDTLCLVVVHWAGPLDQAESVLKPFRDVAPIVADGSGPLPYPALNGAFDALYPKGLRAYWKGAFVKDLPGRRDRGTRRARIQGSRGDLHDAHVSDQRRLPSRRSERHRLRLPRRHLRDGVPGRLDRPGQGRRADQMAARLLRGVVAVFGARRLHQLHAG